ncbi:unnamed protein product [Brassica oleracea var. botrytis]
MDLISKNHNNKYPNTTPSTQPPTTSRYENQKRRDWNTFCQYLRNHCPPLSLTSCSGAHVIEFLRYLDQFGKLKSTTKTAPSLASQILRSLVLVLSDKLGAHLTLLSVVSVPPTRRTVELPRSALLAQVQSGFS